MNSKWVGSVALALVIGLGGGYGIRAATTPTSHTVTLPNGRHFTFPAGGGGFAGGPPGGFGATGTVASVSGNTLEVQGANGQVTVNLGASTTITKTVSAKASAIAVGMCVTAVGKTNSIGAVSATRVVVSEPTSSGCSTGFRGGFGGG